MLHEKIGDGEQMKAVDVVRHKEEEEEGEEEGELGTRLALPLMIK